MNNYRHLAPAALLFALILIFVPMFDTISGLLPVRMGDAQWRFGFIGLWSNATLTVGIGSLVGVIAATVFNRNRWRVGFSIFCWVMALSLIGFAFSFFLDALQTMPLIRGDQVRAFKTAAWIAEGKLLLMTAAFTMMGLAGRSHELMTGWYGRFVSKRAGPVRR